MHVTPLLLEAVWNSLRGGTARERIRRRAAGGLTASQVLERLPPELVPSSEERNPTLARREQVRSVTLVLDALVEEARVERRRARLWSSLVDVYRVC
jgi:hypothetical protein